MSDLNDLYSYLGDFGGAGGGYANDPNSGFKNTDVFSDPTSVQSALAKALQGYHSANGVGDQVAAVTPVMTGDSPLGNAGGVTNAGLGSTGQQAVLSGLGRNLQMAGKPQKVGGVQTVGSPLQGVNIGALSGALRGY